MKVRMVRKELVAVNKMKKRTLTLRVSFLGLS
jgi:hypothetical protein